MSEEDKNETTDWIPKGTFVVAILSLLIGGAALALHFFAHPLSGWTRPKLEYYRCEAAGPPFDETRWRSRGLVVYLTVENVSDYTANDVEVAIDGVGLDPKFFIPDFNAQVTPKDEERHLVQIDRIPAKGVCTIMVVCDTRQTQHSDQEWKRMEEEHPGAYIGRIPDVVIAHHAEGHAKYAWQKCKTKHVKKFPPDCLKRYVKFDSLPGETLRVIARETLHLDAKRAKHLGEGEIEYADQVDSPSLVRRFAIPVILFILATLVVLGVTSHRRKKRN